MKPVSCCHATKAPFQGQSLLRPIHKLATWLLPAAVLALMPKCPACVAAYIALATGLTISLPTATYLRAALIALCVAAWVLIIAWRVRSSMAHRLRHHRHWRTH